MKTRNEALSLFIQFKSAAENFCKETISLLRVDNAPELIHGQMETYCKAQGITYEKTIPDSPPQNGVAERTNLTVCSMARAMLIDANLCDYFWPFSILTAVHIKQRVPYASLPPTVTPYQLWFKHCPNLRHLRPFGTNCTMRIITNHSSKFQPRGESGRFLGYTRDAKGYLIWVTNANNNGGTLKVRRDIIFHNFPSPNPALHIPLEYQPLWAEIPFPNRLHILNDQHDKPYPPQGYSSPNKTTHNPS